MSIAGGPHIEMVKPPGLWTETPCQGYFLLPSLFSVLLVWWVQWDPENLGEGGISQVLPSPPLHPGVLSGATLTCPQRDDIG